MFVVVTILITSDNQRTAFDDLDPGLSLFCQVGGEVIRPPLQNLRGMPGTRPKIHSFVDCPIQFRLQTQLGVRSFYVERNNLSGRFCMIKICFATRLDLLASYLRIT